jgi:hypothetical protein
VISCFERHRNSRSIIAIAPLTPAKPETSMGAIAFLGWRQRPVIITSLSLTWSGKYMFMAALSRTYN